MLCLPLGSTWVHPRGFVLFSSFLSSVISTPREHLSSPPVFVFFNLYSFMPTIDCLFLLFFFLCSFYCLQITASVVISINAREFQRGSQKWTIQRDWEHRVHKMKKNKIQHNTIYVGYHYIQTNTNNINKTFLRFVFTLSVWFFSDFSVHLFLYLQ